MLVHMCCGPCSIYPLTKILDGRYEVYGLFYNPNIHPRNEYKKRLESVKRLAGLMGVNILYYEDYNPGPYFSGLPADIKSVPKDKRCEYCYLFRLEKTAEFAKKNGFAAFSSSLLYSRYQKHELIIALGLAMEKKHGVPFYHEDFRKGWREGIEASKGMGLYRQKYCGCIFSMMERGSPPGKG
ncbi:MAG: epoxyqueuosine reductase QueH [Deltaproteobacteria bacterium]|nr:epoxyqueuosine reductase QueH [Deltaproteobacteria bacterium]